MATLFDDDKLRVLLSAVLSLPSRARNISAHDFTTNRGGSVYDTTNYPDDTSYMVGGKPISLVRPCSLTGDIINSDILTDGRFSFGGVYYDGIAVLCFALMSLWGYEYDGECGSDHYHTLYITPQSLGFESHDSFRRFMCDYVGLDDSFVPLCEDGRLYRGDSLDKATLYNHLDDYIAVPLIDDSHHYSRNNNSYIAPRNIILHRENLHRILLVLANALGIAQTQGDVLVGLCKRSFETTSNHALHGLPYGKSLSTLMGVPYSLMHYMCVPVRDMCVEPSYIDVDSIMALVPRKNRESVQYIVDVFTHYIDTTCSTHFTYAYNLYTAQAFVDFLARVLASDTFITALIDISNTYSKNAFKVLFNIHNNYDTLTFTRIAYNSLMWEDVVHDIMKTLVSGTTPYTLDTDVFVEKWTQCAKSLLSAIRPRQRVMRDIPPNLFLSIPNKR